MDSTGDDPLSPNSLFGNNWSRKKSRFDDDGLSISPPDDDSSFFSLRFGAHHKPNESMYDRINKELGLSVEAPKRPLTPEFIAPASKSVSDGRQAELFLGTSGIRIQSSIKQQSSTAVSVISGSGNDSPRIIIPSTVLEQGEELLQFQLNDSGDLGDDLEKPENSLVAQQDVETLVRKVRGGRPTRKISMNLADTIDRNFLESVQDLKIENPLTPEQPKPHCLLIPTGGSDIPSLVPSLIDSIPVVSGIRDRSRKVSAPPSLNPMKASNFFFTGGLFSAVTTTASSMGSSDSPMSIAQQTAGLITQTTSSALIAPASPLKQIDSNNSNNFSLAQTTVLMEEGASQAAAFEPRADRMGKRRPKASALREMNFWAPQSM